MKLCMFHPAEHPLERGWVGRIDGDRVVQLAAQTLQSFFTGGGTAREHAEYPLGAVVLLAPVLHPPTVRLFEDQETFTFANPAAIVGPGATITPPRSEATAGALRVLVRPAAVVGAEGALGGFTILAEWRADGVRPPKDRDFALGLGPFVVTPEEATPAGLDWEAALAHAASGTVLYPGDVLAGPAAGSHAVAAGATAILELASIGRFEQGVGRP